MATIPDEITVVIPTFNRIAYLQRAVQSVLQETRIPVKVHIFDNASSDGTQNFLEKLAAENQRVLVSRNDENIGAIANYIKAMENVDSDYFVPLADDDWLLPNFLYNGFNMLKAHPDAGAAVFFAEAVNEAGERLVTYPDLRDDLKSGYLAPKVHLREWMNHGHYLWSAILWTKESLEYIGYPYFHAGSPSDVDFQAQIFAKFPVVLSTSFGAVYFMHPTQHSSQLGIKDIPSWAKIMKRLDKNVSPFFDAVEYSDLRAKVLNRYRGAWVTPPQETLPQKRLRPLAVLAAEQLADLETASKLLEMIDDDEGR